MVEDLVNDVGTQLGRKPSDLEPYVKLLEENWYDNVDSIAKASPEDLTAIGLPRRFAVELCGAATGGRDAPATGGRDAPRRAGPPGDDRRNRNEREECMDFKRGKCTYGAQCKFAHRDGPMQEVDRRRSPPRRSPRRSPRRNERREDHRGDRGKGDRGKGKGDKGEGKGSSKGKTDFSLPVDSSEFDFDYNVRQRLLGERTCNVFHIQDSTGIHVHLRGNQKDGTLEFVLQGESDKIDEGAKMVGDLIESVHSEYNEWLAQRDADRSEAHRPEGNRPDGNNKDQSNKDKGKKRDREVGGKELAEGEIEETMEIPTDGLDENHLKNLRGDLVGEGGCNMKHIEKASGASVQVNKRDNEFKFVIRGPPHAVEEAQQLCSDLSESVFARLEEADGEEPGRPRRPKGEKGGKGAGKDRRRGGRKGDDRKRQRT